MALPSLRTPEMLTLLKLLVVANCVVSVDSSIPSAVGNGAMGLGTDQSLLAPVILLDITDVSRLETLP